MNLLFVAPQPDLKSEQEFRRVIEMLERLGGHVSSQLGMDLKINMPDEMREDAQTDGLSLHEAVDGFIVVASRPTTEIHHTLAQAIVLKKPTLCVYERGKEPREILNLLRQKTIPASLVVKSYPAGELEKRVLEFLPNLEAFQRIERPTIKFTLRTTRPIERYMQWKSDRLNVSKVDFIRDVLKKMMDNDADYQTYLKGRSKKGDS